MYKFNINWVRSALAALEIAVDDKNDLGECKAALSTYYIKLNAAKSDLNAATSEVEEVGGSATKSTAKDDAHFRALRDRGVQLKNAPSPQKVACLHWKAHSKPDLAFLTGSLKSLMALIGKPCTDRPDVLHWITDEVLSACPEDAVLGVDPRDLEALYLAIFDGTAAVSASLVQPALCLERTYLETFMLTLQTTCAELPETHPLREAFREPPGRTGPR